MKNKYDKYKKWLPNIETTFKVLWLSDRWPVQCDSSEYKQGYGREGQVHNHLDSKTTLNMYVQ